tara:strand:+ start:805 stop:1515 length:711 start_codon:yes stop_codon:yes gene_type:complete
MILLALLISSCDPNDENLNKKILINFSHHVDGQELSSENMNHTNLAGESYNVKTLKYILSDIRLLGDNKTEILLKDIHYVDIDDVSTSFFESNLVELGLSTSYYLSFTFGLDSNMNITNNYVNESFHTTMAWPELMGGGYHYMRLEGAYQNDSTFYNTHTGPTMGMDYSFSFTEGINIDNSIENQEFLLSMNLNNWYQNPNTINLANGIMMDMPKQMQLMNNGMTDVFYLQGILDK